MDNRSIEGSGTMISNKPEVNAVGSEFTYICEIDGVITVGHPEMKGEGQCQ